MDLCATRESTGLLFTIMFKKLIKKIHLLLKRVECSLDATIMWPCTLLIFMTQTQIFEVQFVLLFSDLKNQSQFKGYFVFS